MNPGLCRGGGGGGVEGFELICGSRSSELSATGRLLEHTFPTTFHSVEIELYVFETCFCGSFLAKRGLDNMNFDPVNGRP